MTALAEQIAADLADPPPWRSAKLTREGKELKPYQQPPPGDWRVWVLAGGRGAGKTEGAAVWLAGEMHRHPGMRALIVAPTFDDAIDSCVRGPSGLMAHDPTCRLTTRPGGTFVLWPNGSEARVLGSHLPADVDRFRAAGNRRRVWWEELAASRQLGPAWDIMMPGLRGVGDVRIVASTTPRVRPKYREILADPRTVATRGTMYDNRENLGADVVADLERRYGGTRLGRQEIEGLLLEDSERALVRRQWIEDCRVDEAPEGLVRVRAVGLDPGGQDKQALAQVGSGLDGFLYVERSEMVDGSATDYLRHAIRVASGAGAGLIVEKNHGGTYLTELLSQVMQSIGVLVGVREVWASAGKQARAEPVALLIEQHKVRWVGSHPQLEDELCSWEPESGDESPHLLDAMVWAATSVMSSATVGHEADLAAVPYSDRPYQYGS